MSLEKLKKYLPKAPKRNTSIFSGANYWKEWFHALKDYFFTRELDYVSQYEKALVRYFGSGDVLTFSSGRMALYTILKAYGIKEGDEVILPAYTCAVVPLAIKYSGAKPIYVDIEKKRFNFDLLDLEKKIGPKTKVIIAQHTYGIPSPIDEIRKIVDKHNLILIEDCAHSLGGQYKGRLLGTFGHASFFSTDRSKIMNTSLGGFVLFNELDRLHEAKRIYSNSPVLDKRETKGILRTFLIEFILYRPYFQWIGTFFYKILARTQIFFYLKSEFSLKRPKNYPSRISNPIAKIGLSQLSLLEENLKKRRENISHLNKILGKGNEFTSGEFPLLLLPVLTKKQKEGGQFLAKRFNLSPWFLSIAHGMEESELVQVDYELGSCPVAEEITKKILTIPTHKDFSVLKFKKFLLKFKNVLENS